MNKPLIAANWKMNKTNAEGIEFIEELRNYLPGDNVEVLICPPFVMLSDLKKYADSSIKIGAQNVYFEERGAFTGEVSVEMLESIGVDYILIGHSERRAIFGETDDIVNNKILTVLKSKIKPILCVGENIDDRKSGKHFDVVKSGVLNSLKDVRIENGSELVIAYEPVWAIGTGVNASPEDAEEMLSFIREELNSIYGSIADNIRLLYGGSVKPSNIGGLMDKQNIDGALVGGASLDVEDFAKLINYGEKHES